MMRKHSSRFVRNLVCLGAGFLAVAAIVMIPTSASAQRGGFSEIPGSARGSALAHAVVAFPGASDAAYWNPAGLLSLDRREVSFTYADLFQLGLVRQTSVHFGWPILEKDYEWNDEGLRTIVKPAPAKRTFGLLVSSLNGDLEGGSYSETQVGLLYAWRLPAGLHAGAALRFLSANSDVADLSASGRAVDLGVLRRVGPIDVGFLARNLVASVDYNAGEDEPPPLRWHVGAAWQPAFAPLRAGIEWSGDTETSDYTRLGGGLEWTPVSEVTLRGGLARHEDPLGSELAPSAGVGLRWREFAVDYAFTAAVTGRPDETHRWSASLGL